MDLGEGWKSRLRVGLACRQSHHHSTPNPNPSPQPVTEAPERPVVTAIRKAAMHETPEPKPTAAPKPATGKSMKKAASVKTAATKPTSHNQVVPTQRCTSLLEEISDVDHLPLQADVELTCRFLTSISSLPTGAARLRAVLKTVLLFVA